MSLRPRYSLLTLLLLFLLTALIVVGVKLWIGPHHVVERPAADTVKFSVRDGGPGLTPEDLRLVFRKFSRLSARATGGEKSSSIGLSIAHRLVDMHGGTIGCENHPEGGAVFWFVLPSHQPAAATTAD